MELCSAARTGTGNQTKRGRGEREEETEGGADGAGETAEGGWDGKKRFTVLLKCDFEPILLTAAKHWHYKILD